MESFKKKSFLFSFKVNVDLSTSCRWSQWIFSSNLDFTFYERKWKQKFHELNWNSSVWENFTTLCEWDQISVGELKRFYACTKKNIIVRNKKSETFVYLISLVLWIFLRHHHSFRHSLRAVDIKFNKRVSEVPRNIVQIVPNRHIVDVD